MHDRPTETPRHDRDRLNGWKEIASHLDKGVRTVQRWEREHGLPVRRIGSGTTEIVFAFRREIDAWCLGARPVPAATDTGVDLPPLSKKDVQPQVEAQSTPAVAPAVSCAEGFDVRGHEQHQRGSGRWFVGAPGRWRVPGLIAVVGALVGAAAGYSSGFLTREPVPTGEPATWSVFGDSLHVFGRTGAGLWAHAFPFALADAGYTAAQPGDAPPVRVRDLNGDGHVEVVFLAKAYRREDRSLYVFGHDGVTLFERQPQVAVQFGSKTFAAPWLATQTYVLPGDGRPELWVVWNHGLLFPSFVERLDMRGRPTGVYWSNGYITDVEVAQRGARRKLLVGATNNEFQGASLAVLDASRVEASAPAENDRFRCANCPGSHPNEFFVFPKTCLVPRGYQPYVYDILAYANGDTDVLVQQGAIEDGHATVVYSFDREWSLTGASLSPEFALEHHRREQAGQLDHPLAAHGARAMLPVRAWRATGFVDLPLAAVQRSAAR